MNVLPNMAPEAALLTGLLDRWLPGANLTHRQWWSLRRAVIRIGSALGVVDELARLPFEQGTVSYQSKVIAEGVDALVRRSVDVGPTEAVPFAVAAAGGASPVAGVVPAEIVPRLDINAADTDQLAGLPGLGGVSARRIVARRDARGPYVDLEDARRAGNVSKAAFARATVHLYVGAAVPPRSQLRETELIQRGGLSAYLQLWQDGRLSTPHLSAETAEDALVTLVQGFAAAVRAKPAVPRLWAPGRRRLRRGSRALGRATELEAAMATDAQVAPIFSSGYLPKLVATIDAATATVIASMFYFTVGEADVETDPGDEIVTALERAIGRGVDVRLILDDDVPTDRHGAQLVNATTFSVLEAKGIPFRRDHLEVTSHAKAIVVDAQNAIVGSHNWTASSFFRYQETSLFVRSNDFGQTLFERLSRRWQMLAPKNERIVPVEHLESLDSDQKGAVLAAGLADGPAFVSATRLKAQRDALVEPLLMGEDDIANVRRIVNLMQTFPISETAAVALIGDGLDSASEVRRATAARLQQAFARMPALPEPFGLREILPEVADRLAAEEG